MLLAIQRHFCVAFLESLQYHLSTCSLKPHLVIQMVLQCAVKAKGDHRNLTRLGVSLALSFKIYKFAAIQ